jgi:hypothetical protein
MQLHRHIEFIRLLNGAAREALAGKSMRPVLNACDAAKH